MGKIGVFLYPGFQEMEFWYPVLRLREIGADVVVIGVEGAEASASALDYPVIPNIAMSATKPEDYVALVIPGGNVSALLGNDAFRRFLADAKSKGVKIAAASQASPLAPEARLAPTTDDVPQMMRNLIMELS